MKNISILILILFIIGGCSTKKKISQESKIERDLVQAYESNELDFKELKMTNTLQLKGPMNLGFSGEFRIHKNEKIWGIFKKFGFEAARVLIRPDSFFVKNTLQKTFIAEDINAFDKLANVQLDYSDIEQLLLGGPIKKGAYVQTNDSTIFQIINSKESDIELQHILARDLVRHSLINVLDKKILIQVDYDAYTRVENASLPKYKKIAIQGNKPMSLTINTKEINLNVQNKYPFSIPENYTRISM